MNIRFARFGALAAILVAGAAVVHADQTFVWHRPIRTGDTVTGVLSIDKVRCRGAMEIVGVTVRLATLDGEPLVDSSSTFVHTRAAS